MLHALRRLEHHGELDASRSAEAREALGLLPIVRYPSLPVLVRVWSLRHDVTTFDAMYLALADALETSLVTADSRLASAARRHTDVDVVLLA